MCEAGGGLPAGHHVRGGAEETPHEVVLCRQEGADRQERQHPGRHHRRLRHHTPHRVRLLPLQPRRHTGYQPTLPYPNLQPTFSRLRPRRIFSGFIADSNYRQLVEMLTLSWPGKFLFHPKIGCFNFKPQYLLNYSSPKNDLYSVRKRCFAALAPNFAPKLCTRLVSACFSACFKTCWGRFDPMLIPVG